MHQADVPVVQDIGRRSRLSREVHPSDGRRPARRLPLQVPQLGVGRYREGRAAHARKALHPPGFAGQWRPLDETVAVVSQTETDE